MNISTSSREVTPEGAYANSPDPLANLMSRADLSELPSAVEALNNAANQSVGTVPEETSNSDVVTW